MKRLIFFLLFLACAATASAQTIKTLGFNSSNGQVVANTGTNVLTFTNRIDVGRLRINSANGIITFDGNQWVDIEEPALYGPWVVYDSLSFINFTNTRSNLGFSINLSSVWTATNAANFQSALFSTNTAPINTTNVAAWIDVSVGSGTNVYKLPVYK